MKDRILTVLMAGFFAVFAGCAATNTPTRLASVSSPAELPDYSMFIALESPIDTNGDGKPDIAMRFLLNPGGKENDMPVVFTDRNRRERILMLTSQKKVRAVFISEGTTWRFCQGKECEPAIRDFFIKEAGLKNTNEIGPMIANTMRSLMELAHSKNFF